MRKLLEFWKHLNGLKYNDTIDSSSNGKGFRIYNPFRNTTCKKKDLVFLNI